MINTGYAEINTGYADQLESVSRLLGIIRIGDISSMAELLTGLDALSIAASQAGYHTQGEAVRECEALVQNIIMDESNGAGEAFEAIGKIVNEICSCDSDPDLASNSQQNLKSAPTKENVEPAKPRKALDANILVDDEIIQEFLEQTITGLLEVEACILRIEKSKASDDDLGTIRRCFHTIKGEAGFLGLDNVEAVCHSTEDLLDEIDPKKCTDVLLNVVDWLRKAIKGISSESKSASPTKRILGKIATAVKRLSKSEAAPANQRISNAEECTTSSERKDSGTDGNGGYLLPDCGYWSLNGDASLFGEFISEAREHLESANAELLNLEVDVDNKEAMDAVFRAFHTIKGTTGFLELVEMQHLAHKAENLLDSVRKGELELTHGLCDLAFDSLDMIGHMLEALKSSVEDDGSLYPQEGLPPLLARIDAAAAGAEVGYAPIEGVEQRLGEVLVQSGAVDQSVINKALAQEEANPRGKKLGELLVESNNVSPKTVAGVLRAQNVENTKSNSEVKESIRVSYDRLEQLVNAVGELVIAESMITQDPKILSVKSEEVEKKLHNLKMISRTLQELGTSIRMVPIKGTFQKMSRLVRDLSSKSGKKIMLIISGEETELDRAYVEKIGDPLVHMLRNAADHGIETPEQRRSAGKTPEGTIQLKAYHEAGNIIVEIQDDGRGIDKDAVLAKAVERGLVSSDDQPTDQEIFDLIFHPGFSTAAAITEVSGRGVGMDVVRRNIEMLRGNIQTTSEIGKGTTFKLVLPLTMALIDGMVVRVGAEQFILPVLSVEEAIRPEPDMVNTVMGRGELLIHRNNQIPIMRLAELFGIETTKADLSSGLIVVIEKDGGKIGLAVDELIGLQQTVIKTLGASLAQAEGLAGGAIMADGTVGLILDIHGIFRLARRQTGAVN